MNAVGLGNKIAEPHANYKSLTPKEIAKKVKILEDQMYQHAKNLEFEEAAKVRDEIKFLQAEMMVV